MSPPPRAIWAYTYRLVPPQSRDQLKDVKAMFDREHRDAKRRDGTWEARFVVDERVSHILVLSDSPEIDLAVNGRIEAGLRAIDAGFAVTIPLAVDDASTAGDDTPPPAADKAPKAPVVRK